MSSGKTRRKAIAKITLWLARAIRFDVKATRVKTASVLLQSLEVYRKEKVALAIRQRELSTTRKTLLFRAVIVDATQK